MPSSSSYNRIRNKQLHQQWDHHADAVFSDLGLTRDSLKDLQSSLQGKIVLPSDPNYNTDRKLANPEFDYYPIAIVYCSVDSDVQAVLLYAQQNKTGFEVRSGGHCTAGFSSGPGILIDVSKLDSICVDSLGKTATVGCGVKFGDFNSQLNLYGLHVPGGECPDVCVGGYMQGGGYGFTSVTFGMNCDNVLSARVMLVDGSIVLASEKQNSDLWWAIRGGTGGNFGVVLSVTYQLYELDEVLGWALIWPLENEADFINAATVMMELQKTYMADSPYAPYLNTQVSLCYQNQVMPHDPIGPEKPYLMLRGIYVGTKTDGLKAIAPLQAQKGCTTQWTLMRPYASMNDMLLSYPQEMPTIPLSWLEAKATRYVETILTLEQWAELMHLYTTADNNTAYMYLEFYGGETNSKTAKNAFVHRNVAYNAVMDVFWNDARESSTLKNSLLPGLSSWTLTGMVISIKTIQTFTQKIMLGNTGVTPFSH
jgi:hypothetical protein